MEGLSVLILFESKRKSSIGHINEVNTDIIKLTDYEGDGHLLPVYEIGRVMTVSLGEIEI